MKMMIKAPLALTLVAWAAADAYAHPGWVNGTSNLSLINRVPASATNPQTGVVTEASSPTAAAAASRGFQVDGIRISHGCQSESGKYERGSAVDAVSWIWPTGEDPAGLAPMSVGCDASGANCTGAGTQPAVATIPNASQKANYNGQPWPAGTATATTLAEHLCVDASCAQRVTSLRDRFTPLGNLAYFKTFQAHRKAPGFWARGRKLKDAQITAFSSNYGVPYASAVQIVSVSNLATPTVPNVFSPESCARKLVVRPAGADICRLDNRKVIKDPHRQNLWFAGPTEKFQDGHGVHENFWMGYNLLVRDVSKNPYPAKCADRQYGDYDLVVMPTIQEIDDNLPFPGWARGK